MNNIFEVLRYSLIGLGIFLAIYSGGSAAAQFHTLFLFIVIPLAGFTGIESLFFSGKAAIASGYGSGSAYQRQSGMNNLAVAITAVVVFIFNWGVLAEVSIMLVMLIFLTMSGVNHLYSAIKENNKIARSYMRPVMTILLDICVIYFLVNALSA